MMEDVALLREYASRGSQAAFTALMDRYLDLVYSVAWRRLGDPQGAQDVTQAVFCLLAQKARDLRSGTVLVAWLYRTACFKADRYARAERRRHKREQEAVMMQGSGEASESTWEEMAPYLDEAIERLEDSDRLAILLRFFQHKPLKEVGLALGTSEDAARMRVNRAVDKLRGEFVQLGITLSSAALAVVLGEWSVRATPVWTAQSIRAAAMEAAKAAGAASMIGGLISLLVKTKLGLLAVAGLTVVVAGGVVLHGRNRPGVSAGPDGPVKAQAPAQTAPAGLPSDPAQPRPSPQTRGSRKAPAKPGEANRTTDMALALYAELTGRTVLRPSTLPQLTEAVLAEIASNPSGAVALIEGELAMNGVEIIPDGEKFVKLLPLGWRDSPIAQVLARIPPPVSGDTNTVLKGYINFNGVDINQCLTICAELSQRTMLRPTALGGPTIKLQTSSGLTKSEVSYALKVVLALNGYAAVDDGDSFQQVVLASKAAELEIRAPHRESGEALIALSDIPLSPRLDPDAPASDLSGANWSKRWTIPSADDFAAYYAKLTGRTAVPSPQYGQRPILFRPQSPLTKRELLYAIETTLALNNLAIVPVDGQTIRVGHLLELNRRGKTTAAAR